MARRVNFLLLLFVPFLVVNRFNLQPNYPKIRLITVAYAKVNHTAKGNRKYREKMDSLGRIIHILDHHHL